MIKISLFEENDASNRINDNQTWEIMPKELKGLYVMDTVT